MCTRPFSHVGRGLGTRLQQPLATYHTNPRPAIFSLYFDTILTYLPNDSHDIVKFPVPFSTLSSLANLYSLLRLLTIEAIFPAQYAMAGRPGRLAMEARARIKSRDYFMDSYYTTYSTCICLLRASVMSIRGTRSSATRGALHEPIELQATKGQLQVV